MSSSGVAFPSTDPFHLPPTAPVPHAAHLPFRRISLPSVANLTLHRQSVASIASFDSLAEEGGNTANLSPTAVIVLNAQKHHKGRHSHPDQARRVRRRTFVHIDETRLAKRRRVIDEFYDTERSYADGLELIYSHFLTPIIESLDAAHPLLSRTELTAIFSNFIDIWNFHRSFFTSLTAFLSRSLNSGASPSSPPSNTAEIPPLSPLLLAHFPYLSLYTPFVTSFSTSLSTLTNLSALTSPPTAFSTFILEQESHPRCANLHLRDWLLTIVQRCPRYLLLLKDLINCTDRDDPEYTKLEEVHKLVSKITTSLNTSISAHSQTLELLALQRTTTGLPFSLVAPGRALVKRGTLLQIDSKPARWFSEAKGSVAPVQRDFLLLSDYLIWLEGGEREPVWNGMEEILAMNTPKRAISEDLIAQHGNESSSLIPDHVSISPTPTRPFMERSRSKSEAELGMMKAHVAESELNTRMKVPSSPTRIESGLPTSIPSPRKKKAQLPRQVQRTHSSNEKWVYRGKLDLVDVEIVVGSTSERERGEGRRFEILSPERSFSVYAESAAARDAWTDAIRNAKSARLVSLNAIHPNSTLTSSASTAHLRRSLQALPHSPQPQDSSDRGGYFLSPLFRSDSAQGKRTLRHHVEHYVPPVWVPDAKISTCMRCSEPFGWRRRRHHCRLCGRCVCASCSSKTFFIADPSSPTSSPNSGKPARACDECYETVFPPIPESTQSPQEVSEATTLSETRLISPSSPSPAALSPTLTSFPTWFSIPSRPHVVPEPEALMAIDEFPTSSKNTPSTSPSKRDLHIHIHRGSPSRRDLYANNSPKRETLYGTIRHQLHRIEDSVDDDDDVDNTTVLDEDPFESGNMDGIVRSYSGGQISNGPPVRIRVKAPSRPRSYYEILEDFHGHERSINQSLSMEHSMGQDQSLASSVVPSPSGSHFAESITEPKQDATPALFQSPSSAPVPTNMIHELPTAQSANIPYTSQRKNETGRRNEDTARRHKRFSLPAIALQTTPVTARSNVTGKGLAKRFSLVLASTVRSGSADPNRREHSSSGQMDASGASHSNLSKVVERGVAATALYELLRGRKRGKVVAS